MGFIFREWRILEIDLRDLDYGGVGEGCEEGVGDGDGHVGVFCSDDFREEGSFRGPRFVDVGCHWDGLEV